MLLEFVAAVVAAFFAAGLALIAVQVSRGRLPRWLIPAAAGSGMLAYAVWSEYSWYGRVVAELPPTIQVALVSDRRTPLRPWTWVVPLRDRFIALDLGTIRTNPAAPDQRLGELMFFGRWAPLTRVAMVFDCAGGRIAPLATASPDADGVVREALWEDAGAAGEALALACREA